MQASFLGKQKGETPLRVYFETYVEVDAQTYLDAIAEMMSFLAKDYPSLPIVDDSVAVEDEEGNEVTK